jgi:nucleotide-binding universal stress UspA family protein
MVFRKILVAIDRSSSAPAIFKEALGIAKATGASLLVVHCLHWEYEVQTGPFLGIGTLGDIDAYGTMKRIQQERLEREISIVKDWLKFYTQQGTTEGVSIESSYRLGDAGVSICEAAASWDADLILLGRRGHQGWSELLLGSVSNYVMHHAPCSVLVVQGTLSDPISVENTATAVGV